MPTPLDSLRALVEAARELGRLLEALDETPAAARSDRSAWYRIGASARDVYLAAAHLSGRGELRRKQPRGSFPRSSRKTRRHPCAPPRIERRSMVGMTLRRPGGISSDFMDLRSIPDQALSRAVQTAATYRGVSHAAALEEAMALYVTLSGPWPAFVFRENRAFTIQFANQAALDLLGYKLEELFGQSMLAIYDERTRQSLDISGEFMQAGGVRNIPVGIRKKSGETRAMRLFAQREVKSVGTPRIYAAWKDA